MGVNIPNSPYLTEDVVKALNRQDSGNVGYWIQRHNAGFSNITETSIIDFVALNRAYSKVFKALFEAAPGNERIQIACFNLALILPTLEILPRMGEDGKGWLEEIRNEATLLVGKRPAFKEIISLLSEE